MGATKKRRQTKHRGNAAGMVESRGRTGARGPLDTPGKRKGPQPPKPASWNRAATKALIPVGVLIPLLLIVSKGNDIAQTVPLIVLAYVVYVPMSYFSDRWIYARWLKKTAA